MPDQQTPMCPEAEKQRFDQLVPFFLTGKLSAEDDLFFRGYLAKHPESIDGVLFGKQISDALHHIGADRNQQAAKERFRQAFDLKVKQSKWIRLKTHLERMVVKPWAIALLSLFVAENAYLIYQANHYHRTAVLRLDRGLVIADSEARFVLNDGVRFEDFLNVAEKYEAAIIYSSKTSLGYEVHVDIHDESKTRAFAEELADNALVKQDQTKIAAYSSGQPPLALGQNRGQIQSLVAKYMQVMP